MRGADIVFFPRATATTIRRDHRSHAYFIFEFRLMITAEMSHSRVCRFSGGAEGYAMSFYLLMRFTLKEAAVTGAAISPRLAALTLWRRY